MTQRRGKRSERGAVLVEAALISSVFFFLIFLIFQGAMYARSALAASDAATAGARAGGVGAQDPLADWDVLNAIARSTSAASANQIEKIIVFRATGPDYALPPGCANGPTSSCNHYSGDDVKLDESAFLADGFSKDDNWPSALRAGPSDRIGVYVRMKASGLGGPLPDTVERSSVSIIEPQ